MKAILVIDMPDKCNDCPLMTNDMYCKAFEGDGIVTKRCVEDYIMQGTRHPYCPLKSMPEKFEERKCTFYGWNATVYERIDNTQYELGWNACIDVLEDPNGFNFETIKACQDTNLKGPFKTFEELKEELEK